MADIDELAAAQHGMVSAAQARRLGISSAAVRWRIRSGRWREVHPRTYAVHTGPLLLDAACWAALLYAGPGAVLSHATAAAVHGLRDTAWETVHVTVPASRRVRSRPQLRVHRSAATGPSYETVRRGLRVHVPERALLDLAADRPGRAPAVLAAGVQERLTTAERLQGCLLSLPPNQPRRGVLDRAIADVAGGTRSELERRCLRLLREAGLPEPVRNHPISLPGRRAWLDLCYPQSRVALEIDGQSFHFWAESWTDDLSRQNDLLLAGWLLLRFTAVDLRRRPAAVQRSVGEALVVRGAA